MDYHEEEVIRREPEEKVVYKDIEIEIEESESYWEFQLFGGTANLDADNVVLSNLAPFSEEADKAIQNNQGDWKSWTVQAGMGYVIPLFDSERFSDELQWLPAIKPQINAYYLKGNIEGDLYRYYQYTDLISTDYKMDFESTRLMFDVALTFASWRNVSVYGIAGIGPAWNRIGFLYGEYSTPEVKLNKHTQTNFAYEFGGGLTYALSEHLSITAEYLYTGFNDVELGDSGNIGHDLPISEVKSNSFDLNSQAVLVGFNLAL